MVIVTKYYRRGLEKRNIHANHLGRHLLKLSSFQAISLVVHHEHLNEAALAMRQIAVIAIGSHRRR